MPTKKSQWAAERAAAMKLAARLYPVVATGQEEHETPPQQAIAHLQLEAMRYEHLAKQLKQRGQ